MGVQRSDRLWLIGGVLAIIAIVAASWFLVIAPKFVEADEVRAETETAELHLVKLRQEVNALAAQAEQEEAYRAKLKTSRAALPTSYDVPAFLRQVQDSGAAVDVQVSGFAVGSPTKSGALPGAAEVPITLNATGSAANISRFLNRLQTVQSRAVLVSLVGLGPGSKSGLTASISLNAFCMQADPTAGTSTCKAA